MDTLFAALPLSACPIMMGAMMWWMARKGHNHDHGQSQGQDLETARLRAELVELRRSPE